MSDNTNRVSRRQFLGKAGVTVGTVAAAGVLVGCSQQQAAPPASQGASQATAAPAQGAVAAAPVAKPASQGGPWGFGNQIDEIKKRGKIIIACAMRYPPEMYRDPKTNEPAGYSIEVGKMIAKDLEVQIEWGDVEWDAQLPGLVAGKYDIVLNGIANRPSRAMAMQFTRGYVPYEQVLLVKADAKEAPWQEWNTKGKKISAQEGATAEYRAREAFPNAEIVPLKNPEVMLEVAAGRADACLIEAYLAHPFATNHPNTKVLKDPATGKPQSLATEWGCIPVRPGEHAFMHYLDNWLAWYQDHGNLSALYEKTVGPTLRGEVTWEEKK